MDDVHDMKARINVMVSALEKIAAIAKGSTTLNSLPNIAKIASLALICQETDK